MKLKAIRKASRINKEEQFLSSLATISSVIVGAVISGIVLYVLVTGLPNVKLSMFQTKYTSENASIFPALINTLIILSISLSIGVVLGVGSAVFLSEYVKSGNPLVRLLRITSETLSGIPSIVYGLAGYMIFSLTLGWQFSLLSGAMTLSIMILPLIMRTTEEALNMVETGQKEGSMALGAGRFRTLVFITLPQAKRGIINGIILSSGRVIGESAALIYTAGTVAHIPHSLFGSGRTLSVHLYALWCEGLRPESASATAAILVVFSLLLNFISRAIVKES